MVIYKEIADIRKNIVGRVATEDEELELLCQMVLARGKNTHLEIGVLFGGSLALAGRALHEVNPNGLVVGIDPLDGYYIGKEHIENINDPITNIPVDVNTCLSNLDNLCPCEYLLCQTKSNPFPLAEIYFDTVFIDGDHEGDAPYQDFLNVCYRTNTIMFDNVDGEHGAVVDAVAKILARGDWCCWGQTRHGIVITRYE